MSDQFKIEKGIPLPGEKGSTAATAAQTLRNMEVGDSFLYPKEKRANLFTTAYRLAGIKIATRSVDDKSVRVWRTE